MSRAESIAHSGDTLRERFRPLAGYCPCKMTQSNIRANSTLTLRDRRLVPKEPPTSMSTPAPEARIDQVWSRESTPLNPSSEAGKGVVECLLLAHLTKRALSLMVTIFLAH